MNYEFLEIDTERLVLYHHKITSVFRDQLFIIHISYQHLKVSLFLLTLQH